MAHILHLALKFSSLIISFLQRLEVFQSLVIEDRAKLGISTSRSERSVTAYIDIHRQRILEDGYRQLSLLRPKSLKGTIRVKFINEQVCALYCCRQVA